MKVKNLGSNVTEVETSKATILVSYATPVAACLNEAPYGYVKTSKKWSPTTSKHINKWLAGAKAEERPQEFFDNLL